MQQSRHRRRLCRKQGFGLRRLSGLGKKIGQGQVIRRATFSQNLSRHTGTTTALAAYTHLFAELAHGRDTILGRFAYFAVSNSVAKANVHRTLSPTTLMLVIIIVIRVRNFNPFLH